ncbi:lycopene cyclase domain-containing protein [Gracilinema caldarium]|uniref:Lycopene cyclase domain protein n=1 Tax=Gracilinema caldarium (strain ATCC 51460 / DSM 7334 / H1) TaxID=744872 RepID=F8F385_GRAC1|nr:lycopene cyclase domain-containing protein [Gracilinema caldarium]AEJ20411.1 lycopene cyclase domain protein [Gracilinema caldarium DSM 7334]
MLYVLLDLLVLAFPLTLSFNRKVGFYKSWPAVFSAILGILFVFGAWDVWKTSIGVWSFNPGYAGTWNVLGLPLGEWLFFICVPYACMFILACVRAYISDRIVPIPLLFWYLVAAIFIILGFILMNKTYTGVVFIAVAIAILAVRFLTPSNLTSTNFWLALALTYIPFFITNGFLTGLPIVLYDDSRNLGIRIGTIPLEDFFFSLSMLLIAFSLYDFFLQRKKRSVVIDT